MGDVDHARVKELQREAGAVDQAKVAVTSISILGGATNYSAALNGASSKTFTPLYGVVEVQTAAAALTGNAQIQIGTAAGGAQIMAAFAITGCTGVGAKHNFVLVGAMPSIAANATIHVRMTAADGSGNAGTVKVTLYGVED